MTTEIVRWPPDVPACESVAAIIVNHNTVALVTFLLWSLHQILMDDRLSNIVVVDNGSEDGSAELLTALADAGLCEVVANRHNAHHGPGLNQGVSHLARRAQTRGASPYWLWILDSDCVISRPDALRAALPPAQTASAAVVGESQADPWHGTDRFGTHCLLIDARKTWQDGITPFERGGDPSFAFLESCRTAGLAMTNFPFLEKGYVIHRGRGSLARLVAAEDRANPLYSWALDHHEPHFGGVGGAAERYEELARRYHRAVPRLDARSLIDACRRRPSGRA